MTYSNLWTYVGYASYVIMISSFIVSMVGMSNEDGYTLSTAFITINHFIGIGSVMMAGDMKNYSLPSAIYAAALSIEVLFIKNPNMAYIFASIAIFSVAVYLYEIAEKRAKTQE